MELPQVLQVQDVCSSKGIASLASLARFCLASPHSCTQPLPLTPADSPSPSLLHTAPPPHSCRQPFTLTPAHSPSPSLLQTAPPPHSCRQPLLTPADSPSPSLLQTALPPHSCRQPLPLTPADSTPPYSCRSTPTTPPSLTFKVQL